MIASQLPADLRAEWDRLQEAFDIAEDAGDDSEPASEAITEFAKRHGIKGESDPGFDPDDDSPAADGPAPPDATPADYLDAMLQAAAEGDERAVRDLAAQARRTAR